MRGAQGNFLLFPCGAAERPDARSGRERRSDRHTVFIYRVLNEGWIGIGEETITFTAPVFSNLNRIGRPESQRLAPTNIFDSLNANSVTGSTIDPQGPMIAQPGTHQGRAIFPQIGAVHAIT